MALNIPPLRPYMLFTDDKGNLTKDAYDFLHAMFIRVGGSLDSLNAATLQSYTWEEPGPIGTTTPTFGKFTDLTGSLLHVTIGVDADSAGIKHMRYLAGVISAGATNNLVVSWPTPFVDANYTPIAMSTGPNLQILGIDNYDANQVTVTVKNTGAGVSAVSIYLIGIHD